MDYTGVLLRAAQVAGVLEGQPRVAGFEQHAEHLAPQVGGTHFLVQFQLAVLGQRFVVLVALFEGLAGQVVKVRHVGGREQGPLAVFEHALHEQVWNPVRGVHVVGAAAVVTGVLAQFEEFLDIQMPGFQVAADRALAFAALVDRNGGIVDDFEEGHNALALAVGALDIGAHGADRRPVVTQAAGKLGQHGVVVDGLVNAGQLVRHGGEVARRQLRTQGAGVEQGRRGGHVVEAGQQVVELDGAFVLLWLFNGQAHGDAHEEDLRQFDTGAVAVQEVAIVQGLQAEVAEQLVAVVVNRGAQLLQVVVGQLGVQQFVVDTGLDVGGQRPGVQLGHLAMGRAGRNLEVTEGFGTQVVEQQAGGDLTVARFALDQGAGGHHQRGVHVDLGHAVVQVLQGFLLDVVGVDFRQAFAGFGDDGAQTAQIQRLAAAVGQGDADAGVGFCDALARLALAGVLFTIEYVGTGDLLFAGAHQRQFDLILNLFDMQGATGGQATLEDRADHIGQFIDGLANPRRGRGLAAFYCQKRLGHGDTDLVVGIGHQCAVAFDDAKLSWGAQLQVRILFAVCVPRG